MKFVIDEKGKRTRGQEDKRTREESSQVFTVPKTERTANLDSLSILSIDPDGE